jgi:hypothetical protein
VEARSLAWLLLLPACGRVSFDPHSDAGGATGDVPADTAALACQPWTNIVRQASLSGAGPDLEPALSPDGLSMVYVSYTGASGLYAATRATLADLFGSQRMLTELSTVNVEHGPLWSADGTKLYFTRDMTGSQPLVATYLGNATFGAPASVALPASGYAYALTADELEVFMMFDVGGGDFDLLHMTGSIAGGTWNAESDIGFLSQSNRVDGYPAFDDGRQDLYYRRTNQLVVTHRAGRGLPFGPAAPVTEINSGLAVTGDPSLSADGLTIAFSSDRAGGEGASDIYTATRVCQ